MSEREKIVAWLRSDRSPLSGFAADFADALDRGEHLKRPEPTIPFEEWKDKPSVGHG